MSEVNTEGIEGQQTHRGSLFPLVITPPKNEITFEETKEWFEKNKTEIEERMEKHGVLLFRGFNIYNPTQFDEVVNGLNYKPFPYEAGNAPRIKVSFFFLPLFLFRISI